MIREVGSGWRSQFKVNVAPSAKSYWQTWSFRLMIHFHVRPPSASPSRPTTPSPTPQVDWVFSLMEVDLLYFVFRDYRDFSNLDWPPQKFQHLSACFLILINNVKAATWHWVLTPKCNLTLVVMNVLKFYLTISPQVCTILSYIPTYKNM